jgi:colanic acid/amylovoran biosynthesis glycosyltransferase
MTPEAPSELLLLPSLGALRDGPSAVRLNLKYLDGARQYADGWPGRVTSLVRYVDASFAGFDLVEIDLDSDDTSTRIEIRPDDPTALAERLRSAAVVLGFLSPFELELERVCRRVGVPLVFTSEYSVRTELQIIAAEALPPAKRLRRSIWTLGAEAKRRWLARRVAGLQCSGTPTYDAYSRLNANTLLFFDNRVPAEEVISAEALEARLATLREGRPLRLAFGGRFTPMKGVLELPKVAHALRRLGLPFRMDIVGDGPQAAELRRDIARRGLGDVIALHPPMDFRAGWIPWLKRECDLFVCCHPQGDPSSTYPEVMSCGVPIAGYGNEAFRGILRHSGAGDAVPRFRPRRLAKAIRALASDRAELAAKSRAARAFARKHTFEITFGNRTRHLIEASRLPRGVAAE